MLASCLMKRLRKLLLGFMMFCCCITMAQELVNQPVNDSLPDFDSYLYSYLIDFKDIVVLPAKWTSDDWAMAAFSVTGAGAIYTNDAELYALVQRSHTDFGHDVATYAIEPWGSGLYSIPLLAAMYGYGKLSKNSRPAKVALQGTKAIVLAGFITGGLKMAFHRYRPFENEGSYQFDGIGFSTDHLSMPSGHTALAFALATTLSCNYRDKPWVGVVAYSLAASVGFSRVYQQQHWASDVFVGALIGYVVGKSVCETGKTLASKRYSLQPWVGGNGGGICLNYKF
jgi:hypothetical protein